MEETFAQWTTNPAKKLKRDREDEVSSDLSPPKKTKTEFEELELQKSGAATMTNSPLLNFYHDTVFKEVQLAVCRRPGVYYYVDVIDNGNTIRVNMKCKWTESEIVELCKSLKHPNEEYYIEKLKDTIAKEDSATQFFKLATPVQIQFTAIEMTTRWLYIFKDVNPSKGIRDQQHSFS